MSRITATECEATHCTLSTCRQNPRPALRSAKLLRQGLPNRTPLDPFPNNDVTCKDERDYSTTKYAQTRSMHNTMNGCQLCVTMEKMQIKKRDLGSKPEASEWS